jgi:hypothetical protein
MRGRFDRGCRQHCVEQFKEGVASTPKQRVYFLAEGSQRFDFWCVHVQKDGASSLFLSTLAAPCSCCWLNCKLRPGPRSGEGNEGAEGHAQECAPITEHEASRGERHAAAAWRSATGEGLGEMAEPDAYEAVGKAEDICDAVGTAEDIAKDTDPRDRRCGKGPKQVQKGAEQVQHESGPEKEEKDPREHGPKDEKTEKATDEASEGRDQWPGRSGGGPRTTF